MQSIGPAGSLCVFRSILEAANGSSVSFDPQGGVILPRFNIPDEPSLPGKFNLATGYLFLHSWEFPLPWPDVGSSVHKLATPKIPWPEQ